MNLAQSYRWWIPAWLLYGAFLLQHFSAMIQLPPWHWLPAIAYALWAAIALGAIARSWPTLTPYGWRPLVIFLGAILSGIDVFSGPGPASAQRIDLWMTALIGIALVSILARFTPVAWSRLWFGQEVRPGSRPGSPR
ncbi:hypothetical protein [Acidithiobacillus acidisediminis]|jgi:hypothetical protein|uniref:hypothetical protein n=1 Tax=Acidithiobacillus TaxID=119977 RepID=UPI00200CB6D2|nr:hypothetical protein [Acidithiobacillus sp. S30A2]